MDAVQIEDLLRQPLPLESSAEFRVVRLPWSTGAIGIGLVVSKGAEQGPVWLRGGWESQPVLAAVVDNEDRIQYWLEAWSPWGVEAGEALPDEERELNVAMERRWGNWLRRMRKSGGAGDWRVGEELSPSPPLVLDSVSGRLEIPELAGGSRWTLCTDSAVLASAGLPGYADSVHRYLVACDSDGRKVFAPLTSGAPTSDSTEELEAALGLSAQRVLVHAGGPLAFFSYQGESLQSFAARLSGERDDSAAEGWTEPGPGGFSGALFTERASSASSLSERVHLKLRLLAGMVESVRNAVREEGVPRLDLGWFSFRVHSSPAGGGLPWLWTARPVLVSPGDASELPIEGIETRYFSSRAQRQSSPFSAAASGRALSGICEVRISRVQAVQQKSGRYTVELRLLSDDADLLEERDLVWLRLRTSRGPIELYSVYRATGSSAVAARRERSLTTVPTPLRPEQVEALGSMAAVPQRGVPFTLTPMLGPACDLYSLGVLGTRLLLVDDAVTATDQMNELQSLANEMGRDGVERPLADRIAAALRGDARWRESLGPHRALGGRATAVSAMAAMSTGIWSGVLAWLVRAIPGAVPESFAGSYGAWGPGAPHAILDASLRDLYDLLALSRRTLFRDREADQELRELLLS